ncbi:MAG: hypothetical protein HKN33_06285 [Pyrinomonadaceae bacterium]|nr:hypothetical protein [Pyrinomonadaceae bacterium]
MLTINTDPSPKKGVMDSLLIKLGLLFFGVMILTAGVFFIWSFFISSFESSAFESEVPVASVVDDIDPQLEKDLEKALKMDVLPEDFAAKDPFVDKTGVSGVKASQVTSVSSQIARALASRSSGAVGTSAGSNTSQRASSLTSNPARTNTARKAEEPRVMNTKDRLLAWIERARFGTLIGEPLPSIYSIDDLVPVGVVDGGDGEQEVMFFSEAADRIVSFSVGTRLHDGIILEVIDEGVVFASGKDMSIKRLKSWGRAIQTRNAGAVSVNTSINETVPGVPVGRQGIAAGGSN